MCQSLQVPQPGGSRASAKVVQAMQQVERKFIQEVNTLMAVRHPYCVLFMGLCMHPEEGRYYIVTEYMSRGTVFDVLHGPLRDQLLHDARCEHLNVCMEYSVPFLEVTSAAQPRCTVAVYTLTSSPSAMLCMPTLLHVGVCMFGIVLQ